MIGQTLGHYRVVEKIGEGGMGVVYRAQDERLERDVALKILPAGVLTDETARKRFRKEALALAKLNHPNIGVIHDFDTQGGVDFLVMEYIPGGTLAERLGGGPPSEKETLALATQIAAALEEAHEKGIVHRDLKPGNVVVTPKGQAKVLDFGLAKLLRPVTAETPTETMSATAAVAGTLPYMSPEQLRGEPADARTDIYATGVILYELTTGRRPYSEQLASQLTDAILHQPPVPPRVVNPRTTPELERIILKCLEKDAENRYQSAKELTVDLRRLAAPTTATAVTAATPARTSLLRVALAGGIGALVLVGVLLGLNVGGLRERLLSRGGATQIESLAVLPLANMSGDPGQEYFADGMTEALISNLAQISALRVISRTSAMRYKGSQESLPEIARELHVDAVIEGSVFRSGNRVRITAQLIHGATDRHLWAKNYERDLRDVLALQDDVARAIAQEVRVQLTSQEQARLGSARPVNPTAHEAYLKGLYHCRTAADLEKGVEFFKQAIGADPKYWQAYAGLAGCYTWLGYFGILPPQPAYSRAKAAALKALEGDDGLSEAHGALALVKLHHDWDWAGAEKEFRRALELKPNDADLHHSYAHYLLATGRGEESAAESRRASELDPVNPMLTSCVGWHRLYTRRYDEAVEYSRKALEIDRNHFWAHYHLGLAYEQKGMFEQAIAAFQKSASLGGSPCGGGSTLGLTGLARAIAMSGNKAYAHKMLSGLSELSRKNYVSPYEVAAIHTALGEKGEAFRALQKAYDERSSMIVHLRWDPRFDVLHSDPRFGELVRRIGLPL